METTITHDGISYTLTTNHSTSSYGQPVLVDADGVGHGPTDGIGEPYTDIFGEPGQLTARMVVAHWAKSHMPDEYRKLDPRVLRFAGL